MTVFNGSTFPPGFQGQPGDVYLGCTFIASCVLGPGSKIIGGSFLCQRNFFGSCRNTRSRVGPGSTMSTGYAEYVDFDNSGTWANVTDGGNTTKPECVDCAPQGNFGRTEAYSGADVVVATSGQTSADDWCKRKCGSVANITHVNGPSIAVKQGDDQVNL
jgi:hypothetical protein